MRKLLLLLVALFLVCGVFTVHVFAEAEQDVRVLVNTEQVDFTDDVKPYIEDGRTMVPLRFVGDELGATFDWDDADNKVTVYQEGRVIELVIGEKIAHIDGEEVDIDPYTDTTAVLKDGRTMVPLRFISEAFGAEVEWVGRARTVYITTEQEEPAPPPTDTVTLYFADDQAQYLVPEERKIELTKPQIGELVFDELLAGPRSADLVRTVPLNTKLISLIPDGDEVILNLSSHFQDEHRGGTAGERMTLYSIINSLAELPDVNKVRFLLEGEPQEAILGHTNTLQPLEPDYGLVRNNQ